MVEPGGNVEEQEATTRQRLTIWFAHSSGTSSGYPDYLQDLRLQTTLRFCCCVLDA